jgi:hypothetical protein
MRKISASLILPVSSQPLVNGIISLDKEGRILDLTDTGGNLREEAGLEFYSGAIVPGFVHPWLRLEDFTGSGGTRQTLQVTFETLPDILHRLDRDLMVRGIKGIGLVINESLVSDRELQRMGGSRLIYHPVIEICPGKDGDDFAAFSRGIELVSRAWNEFNLHCSLTACSAGTVTGELEKYLREYAATHENASVPDRSYPASLNVLETMAGSHPARGLNELLPPYTLEAAAAIFEGDELGSIAPGKKPGLNLLKGMDTRSLRPSKATSLQVLV